MIDPWGTASTLLAWRDELVKLGWDFKRAGHAVRIDALAQIEASGPELPLGIADRIARLANGARRKIPSELLLADDYEDLPLIWRKVIIDHKVINDHSAETCVKTYAPQQETYRNAVQEVCGPVSHVYLHLPIQGKLVEIVF